MKTFFLLALLLFPVAAQAVELRDLSIDYRKFYDGSHFAELPNEQIKEGLALDFLTQLGGPVYWRNEIHALTSPARYVWVGWHFSLEVNVLPGLDVIAWEHHSQHALGMAEPTGHFPVNNSIGLHWTLYHADR